MNFHPNLTYFCDRLSAFGTNYFRLEVQNQTSAKAGQQIIVDLPDNSLLHLASLKILCTAKTDGTNSGGRLCPINNLAERVEVSCGGTILSQGSNFTNVLLDAMVKMGQRECSTLQGHPEMVREKAYDTTDVNALATTASEDYSAFPFPNFTIDTFLGFIDSASPKILDTSLIPSLRVTVFLAPNSVLSSTGHTELNASASAMTGSTITGGKTIVFPDITTANGFGVTASTNPALTFYQLGQIHATIEACSLSDETYDQMVAAMMSNQGFLEIPYKVYHSFQETHTGTSRWTVSSSSIDRVWTTWRAADYNTTGVPVAVSGYLKTPCLAIDGTTAGDAYAPVNIGIGDYDRGVMGTSKEKYQSKFFDYPAPSSDTDLVNQTMSQQLQMNSAYFPNYDCKYGDVLAVTRNSLPMPMGYGKDPMTMDQYLKNYCIQCYRFNLPGSEQARLLSGIDSRQSNLQGIVKTTGHSGNPVLNIFVECTSVLRCGVGRAISTIE